MSTPTNKNQFRERVRSLAKFQIPGLTRQRKTHVPDNISPHGSKSRGIIHGERLSEQERTARPLTSGLPGYRIQPGHTGLDPLENAWEVAFLGGKFLRNLFTGKLRTHKPVYLAAMALVGLLLFVPFVVWAVEATLTTWDIEAVLFGVLLLPLAAIGFALWLNVSTSLQSKTL